MIKSEVRAEHLSRFPQEEEILKRFEPDFYVNWGRRISNFNTELSAYFLLPKTHISQTFGFEQEVLLIIADYPTLQPRTVQSIIQFMQTLPARGRIEQTFAVVVSPAKNVEVWLRDYAAEHPQDRAYVGITRSEIVASHDDWFVRNKFIAQLFSRDLFDYTLPLDGDLFFFGRSETTTEHVDAVRRSENRGLFGLRKTGKTSLLFKIRRTCAAAKIKTLYYDCKVSSIYDLDAERLLSKIAADVSADLPLKVRTQRAHETATDWFLRIASAYPPDEKFSLIFDEIEYISGQSSLAPHWENDFIRFWQALWSAQSQFRKFNFVVAGVNSSVVEVDRIKGVQNPLFGIVKSMYLTGLDLAETRNMLRVIGRRMGMTFEEGAVTALFARYGGHPLLTRMVCSQLNTSIKVAGLKRPVSVDETAAVTDQDEREQEISFYSKHIISELEEFYPSEFEMLEMLAIGNLVDFNDLSDDATLVRHLKSYGLVDLSRPHDPRFRIPIIQKYIAREWKRRTSGPSEWYLVPERRRVDYVDGRVASILRELRAAERKFVSLGLPCLYGPAGPFEAELFAKSSPVTTREQAVSFLNQASLTLVEPIELSGKGIQKDYFFSSIRTNYPKLFDGLNRVKSYRNYLLHLKLNPSAQAYLDGYLEVDFGGRRPDDVVDGWFRLQSATLDRLIVGLQAEVATYD